MRWQRLSIFLRLDRRNGEATRRLTALHGGSFHAGTDI
jgi:hypothetical protein